MQLPSRYLVIPSNVHPLRDCACSHFAWKNSFLLYIKALDEAGTSLIEEMLMSMRSNGTSINGGRHKVIGTIKSGHSEKRHLFCLQIIVNEGTMYNVSSEKDDL